MADSKISDLTELAETPADGDLVPIVDVSDTTDAASGTNKKVTAANLLGGVQTILAEGAFVDGDKTKLDTIEDSADVTDATNVTAAGALMDSEVTNLAQVKAFDTTDYATAAQGSTADTAEQAANKDATGGYAGLTLFKLNLKNAANTFTNFFTNTTTAARTWTLPDKDGTVAMTSDITGTNSGTNTGDQTTVSGNAGTATALETARTIGGTSFDGTANIAIGALTSTNVGATTSAEFAGVISDESGTGLVVLNDSPTFITPALGTPASGVATNITGLPAASVLAGSLGTGAYVMDSSLQVATVELGAATDTTIARSSAGRLTVEGEPVAIEGYTTTATAAGTTTLTVASTAQQYLTGSTTQTVTLPVTSTLVLGQTFTVKNLSTGIVTVNSSGANVVLAIPSVTTAIFTCILITGTTAASWSVSSYLNTPAAAGGGGEVTASAFPFGGDGSIATNRLTAGGSVSMGQFVAFPDGAVENWCFNLVVPGGADGLGISKIEAIYLDESSSALVVKLAFAIKHFAYSAGGAITEDSTQTFTSYTTGGTANKVGIAAAPADSFNAIPGTLAKGDIFNCLVERRGNHADDTYAAQWNLMEYRITFA